MTSHSPLAALAVFVACVCLSEHCARVLLFWFTSLNRKFSTLHDCFVNLGLNLNFFQSHHFLTFLLLVTINEPSALFAYPRMRQYLARTKSPSTLPMLAFELTCYLSPFFVCVLCAFSTRIGFSPSCWSTTNPNY
jgi:hypothetical protein